MIKVFIPESKSRNKTSVRGFWYSQENKKTYYDYLTVKNILTYSEYFIESIQAKYNQEAVFYSNDNIGYIFYSRDKIQILPHRYIINVSFNKRRLLRGFIKSALKLYGGVTVYITRSGYTLEVFTTI